MPVCDVCGNDYPRSFQVIRGNERYTFDSLECAIHLLAPRCHHCGCRIIGHGLEAGEILYCCAHCARRENVYTVVDNA